jgi:hypothetical protein
VPQYLNRLSDLLFVVARVLARHERGSEVLWRRPLTGATGCVIMPRRQVEARVTSRSRELRGAATDAGDAGEAFDRPEGTP